MRRRTWWGAAWVALLALALGVGGCDSGSVAQPERLRVALPGQPASLDPNKATDAISSAVLTQMHEGLTRHSAGLEVKPALAERWEFAPDLKTVTFTLREGLAWSDGAPLTAQHFVDGWMRLLDPATAAEYAYFLYDVVGAEAYNTGKGPADAVGLEAVDARTLRVKLARPAGYFPHIATFMVTYPIRLDVIRAHGDAWTEPEHAVVSGAFRPVTWEHEYKITLEPNPHYALSAPRVKRLEMFMIAEKATALNLFVTGRMDVVLDMLPIAIPNYRGDAAYHNGPKLEVRYVGLRVDRPPLDDVRVRKALALALRRDEVPKVLKGGELPTATWLPKGMFGHNGGIGLGYDPERARALLAEAGYPGGEGMPELTLLFRAGDDWRLWAENTQQQWKRELGITVRIQTREQKVFFQEIDGPKPPPMHLARWIADFPDPENFMGLFTSKSGNNSLAFASSAYDVLVSEAATERDPVKRQAGYDRAQRILLEDEAAIIPVYTGAQNILRNPRLEGLEFNAMDTLYLNQVGWSQTAAQR